MAAHSILGNANNLVCGDTGEIRSITAYSVQVAEVAMTNMNNDILEIIEKISEYPVKGARKQSGDGYVGETPWARSP